MNLQTQQMRNSNLRIISLAITAFYSRLMLTLKHLMCERTS